MVRIGVVGIGNMGRSHVRNLMEGKVKNSLKLPLPSSIIIDCTVTARYSLSSIIYEKNDVTAF